MIDKFSCVKLLSYNEISAEEKRPLVFASNEYVYFEEIGMLKINPGEVPEDFWEQYARRYFFCEDKFVKTARILLTRDAPKHFEEFENECQVLGKIGGAADFPALYAFDVKETEIEQEVWLVRDKITGSPLSVKLSGLENCL